jgi:hypothetical protein
MTLALVIAKDCVTFCVYLERHDLVNFTRTRTGCSIYRSVSCTLSAAEHSSASTVDSFLHNTATAAETFHVHPNPKSQNSQTVQAEHEFLLFLLP